MATTNDLLMMPVIEALPLIMAAGKEESNVKMSKATLKAIAEILPKADTAWLPTLLKLFNTSDPVSLMKEVQRFLGDKPTPTRLADLSLAYWIAHNYDLSKLSVCAAMNSMFEGVSFNFLKDTDLDSGYAIDMCIMCGATRVEDALRLTAEYNQLQTS